MEVNPNQAAAQRRYRGRLYYFCSVPCATKFDKGPEQYVKPEPPGKGQASGS
jgi:YHS domain-containing protein